MTGKGNLLVIAVLLFFSAVCFPARAMADDTKKDAGKYVLKQLPGKGAGENRVKTILVESTYSFDDIIKDPALFILQGVPITYITLSSGNSKAIFNRLGMGGRSNSHIARHNEATRILSGPLYTSSGMNTGYYSGFGMGGPFFNNDIYAGYLTSNGLEINMIPRLLEDKTINVDLGFVFVKVINTQTPFILDYRNKSAAKRIETSFQEAETLMIVIPSQPFETIRANTPDEDRASKIIFITADSRTDDKRNY